MSEAAPSAERTPKAQADSGRAPVEAPVIPKASAEDQHAKEAVQNKLGEHGKGHGHSDHGHDSEFGKKAEKFVGTTFAVGGGTGALMVEPGVAIALKAGGPVLAAKVAAWGLTILAPFATLLGFFHFQKWAVDKAAELAGTKVPSSGKAGGDHSAAHH
jgi:hypothetical protein